MLPNNGAPVKDAGGGGPLERVVATLRVRFEVEEAVVDRLVRRVIRLLVTAAVFAAAARVVETLVARRSDRPKRTFPPGGSLSEWPAVPPAPGRDRAAGN
jgi:hypothetical protein